MYACDTSDNVFSAYPGVRKKGTRNKVGLLEAFADKDTKGYNWNNMMLQRWVDPTEMNIEVMITILMLHYAFNCTARN